MSEPFDPQVAETGRAMIALLLALLGGDEAGHDHGESLIPPILEVAGTPERAIGYSAMLFAGVLRALETHPGSTVRDRLTRLDLELSWLL